ncbi:hypothetical protein T256_05035 [Pediococcus pentosaceus SL4]|nr:hypothetical protein T256_05035 [Pediococcus pentosaceus SL4]
MKIQGWLEDHERGLIALSGFLLGALGGICGAILVIWLLN